MKKKTCFNTFVLLVAALIGFTSCDDDDVEIKTIIIASHKAPTFSFMGNLYESAFYKESGETTWSPDPGIEGFEYEEGFEYTLRVRIEPIKNPPMDASSEKYILLEVLSKEAKVSEGVPELKEWGIGPLRQVLLGRWKLNAISGGVAGETREPENTIWSFGENTLTIINDEGETTVIDIVWEKKFVDIYKEERVVINELSINDFKNRTLFLSDIVADGYTYELIWNN